MEKNKLWLWRAIDGVSRQPLGWQLGRRGDATVKRLIDQVDDGKCSFITDMWPGFFRLLPEDRHFYGKDLTYPIEQTNSDIRHQLARFVRRTKASSRSLTMVHLSLKLVHHLQDNNTLAQYMKPILSLVKCLSLSYS